MAGANNAFLKAVGFRKREIATIRAKYGTILSPKDAANAAGAAGVRMPAKLAGRLAPVPGAGLNAKVTDAMAKRLAAANKKLNMGDKLGRKESALARTLTDRQVNIMSIAQREMASWAKTNTWNHEALKPHEWDEARRLLRHV